MNNTNGWLSRLSKLSFFAVFLLYLVIGLGAFTRLTDAGLSCPDWPACYGHFVVPKNPAVLQRIDAQYPHAPIVVHKAQTEMAHRYLAGVLGIIIVAASVLSILLMRSAGSSFLVYGVLLLCMLVYQVLLGMWTVTFKLAPIVVTQHLLVGTAIIALLWMMYLRSRNKKTSVTAPVDKKLRLFGFFCLALLFLQIGLGGWTSSHDAGTEMAPLVIQMMHYSGALLVTFSFLSLFLWIKLRCRDNRSLSRIAHYLLVLLFFQIILGGVNVMMHVPLVIALLHNLVAVTMLLVLVTVNYHLNSASNKVVTV